MSTREGFEPGTRRLVTDLCDMGQGDRTIFCGEFAILPIGELRAELRSDD